MRKPPNVPKARVNIAAAETATYKTHQRISELYEPANEDELKDLIHWAFRNKRVIHPISAGKNWGYGSRVPIDDGAVLVSLARLDRIVDYDESLGYVTLQPGVTFRALADFLASNNSELVVNSPGSTDQASVVAHALERGIVQGAEPDRCTQVCAVDAITGTGSRVSTGLRAFADCKADVVHAQGIGPDLRGLFSQNGGAIVTRITLWLPTRPPVYQGVYWRLPDDKDLPEWIDRQNRLRREGVIDTSIAAFNRYRILSLFNRYPYQRYPDGHVLSRREVDEELSQIGASAWYAQYAIAGANEAIVAAKKSHLMERAGALAGALEFSELNADDEPNFGRVLSSSVQSAWWRKRKAAPTNSEIDPDADACGIIWLSAAIRACGDALARACEAAASELMSHGFEPQLSIQCITCRCAYLLVSISYDREIAGQDERALACYEATQASLYALGWTSYRTAQGDVRVLPSMDQETARLHGNIRDCLDPAGVISPSRYRFDHKP